MKPPDAGSEKLPTDSKDELVYALLNKADLPALLTSIRDIMREGDAHNLENFDEAAWKWQYEQLPGGEAYIYVVQRHGEILGYYHVPVYPTIIGDQPMRAGMVQDVAISSKLRGMGVFRRLAEFAHQDLLTRTSVDFIYTFPNHRSIHTFLKYNNYERVGPFQVYLLPLKTSRLIASKVNLLGLEHLLGSVSDLFFRMFRMPKGRAVIQQHKEIDAHIECVFKEFRLGDREVGLYRDREYLNWRYLSKPNSDHYIFSLKEEDEYKAAVILKVDRIFDNKALVLMDFAHLRGQSKKLLELLSGLKRDYQEYIGEDVSLFFTAGIGNFFKSFFRIGFVRIPERFNPRPLNLLTRKAALSKEETIKHSDKWHATLSDWDVL